MISLDVIEREISELETRDTSYAVIERLSWLYICKDHLVNDIIAEEKSASVEAEGSEFLDCANGCCTDKLLKLLDEHFAVLNQVCPKEYIELIRRIKELKF